MQHKPFGGDAHDRRTATTTDDVRPPHVRGGIFNDELV
jgi:hypothetical protein